MNSSYEIPTKPCLLHKKGSFCTAQTKDSDLFDRQIPSVQKRFLVEKFQMREKAMFYCKLGTKSIFVDCQKDY